MGSLGIMIVMNSREDT